MIVMLGLWHITCAEAMYPHMGRHVWVVARPDTSIMYATAEEREQ